MGRKLTLGCSKLPLGYRNFENQGQYHVPVSLLDQSEKVSRLSDVKEAWSDYVTFMKEKYGADFHWTCEHLAKIDKLIGDGEADVY